MSDAKGLVMQVVGLSRAEVTALETYSGIVPVKKNLIKLYFLNTWLFQSVDSFSPPDPLVEKAGYAIGKELVAREMLSV